MPFELEPIPTKSVLCQTPGCENAGAIITVADRGQEVQCGVCGAILDQHQET